MKRGLPLAITIGALLMFSQQPNNTRADTERSVESRLTGPAVEEESSGSTNTPKSSEDLSPGTTILEESTIDPQSGTVQETIPAPQETETVPAFADSGPESKESTNVKTPTAVKPSPFTVQDKENPSSPEVASQQKASISSEPTIPDPPEDSELQAWANGLPASVVVGEPKNAVQIPLDHPQIYKVKAYIGYTPVYR